MRRLRAGRRLLGRRPALSRCATRLPTSGGVGQTPADQTPAGQTPADQPPAGQTPAESRSACALTARCRSCGPWALNPCSRSATAQIQPLFCSQVQHESWMCAPVLHERRFEAQGQAESAEQGSQRSSRSSTVVPGSATATRVGPVREDRPHVSARALRSAGRLRSRFDGCVLTGVHALAGVVTERPAGSSTRRRPPDQLHDVLHHLDRLQSRWLSRSFC